MTSPNIRKLFAGLCFGSSLVLAYAFALVKIRVFFAWFDDEGFMMMTLRQYMGGLPLYSRVYTEYGPFYYIFYSTLFRLLGWMVNHDHVRWLTIVGWVLVALGSAVCVWMWSRSTRWAIAALLGTTLVLRELFEEPGHPQDLILLLYIAAMIVTSAYGRLPEPVGFAVIGAVVAGIFFTKINVGLFVGAALVVVFLSSVSQDRLGRLAATAVRWMCVALPTLLMFRQFGYPEVIIQCVVYTFGIWAVLEGLRRHAVPELSWTAAAWGAVGFGFIALMTAIAEIHHGTSFAELIKGVIVQPLRFSRSIPYISDVKRTIVGTASTVIGYGIFRYASRAGYDRVVKSIQTIVALAVIVITVSYPPTGTAIATGVMWTFMPIPGGAMWTRNLRTARFVIVAIASIGLLMIYPVPGTQIYIAAAPVLLAAFAAALDGFGHIGGVIKVPGVGFSVTQRSSCAALLLIIIGGGLWIARHATEEPTLNGRLPNSQLVGLWPNKAEAFSEITRRLSALCDTLVTIPGMNSFHIWSGLPHPNGFIVSSTMVLFDAPIQERVREDFLLSPRPCVVYNAELEEWSSRYRKARSNEPFIDLVKNGMVQVYSKNGYEIRVLPAQVQAWR